MLCSFTCVYHQGDGSTADVGTTWTSLFFLHYPDIKWTLKFIYLYDITSEYNPFIRLCTCTYTQNMTSDTHELIYAKLKLMS